LIEKHNIKINIKIGIFKKKEKTLGREKEGLAGFLYL